MYKVILKKDYVYIEFDFAKWEDAAEFMHIVLEHSVYTVEMKVERVEFEVIEE